MTSDTLLHQWETRRDAEAFRTLVTRYAPMVFATAKRMLGNEFEAEDVAQECFEVLAAGRRRPRGALGPWLHRVAANRCIDRMRSAKSRAARERAFMTDRTTAERAATAQARWDEVYNLVDAAILELPDRLRT